MASSAARTQANGRNALLSTGPRTRAGKGRSSKNALRHGLLSNDVLLPAESKMQFDALRLGLMVSLAPVGELETLLAERVVACAWRLGRVGVIETGLFLQRGYDERAAQARDDASACLKEPADDLRACLTEVIDADGLATAKEARRDALLAARADSTASLGRLYVREASSRDTFTKLARYESGIERSMYRALHELQRLRAAREGQAVPPPVAVDMQVSGPVPTG